MPKIISTTNPSQILISPSFFPFNILILVHHKFRSFIRYNICSEYSRYLLIIQNSKLVIFFHNSFLNLVVSFRRNKYTQRYIVESNFAMRTVLFLAMEYYSTKLLRNRLHPIEYQSIEFSYGH